MQLVRVRSLRSIVALLTIGAVAGGANAPARSALPVVRTNPNTARAGALHDGILTVTLEAKERKGPLMPGPLLPGSDI
jgi:hypothetical protein